MTITPQEKSRLPHDDDFPKRLRQKRLRLGWSQTELAMQAGLRPTAYRTIQEWERGLSGPRPGGHILPVAKALGVSVTWLLWGEEE